MNGSDWDWDEKLREVGLRVTRPRVLVLNLLGELGGHHTAEELNATLVERGSSLTRGTVYNVLDDLVNARLAMRADRGPGTAIYELADVWHHHFVCQECAVVIDVDCVVGESPCLHVEVPGAAVDEAQIIFRGLCADCLAAQ
jgi:Fe2+ or Zn2+ uptake regulation protein